jgi:hypothetical protein
MKIGGKARREANGFDYICCKYPLMTHKILSGKLHPLRPRLYHFPKEMHKFKCSLSVAAKTRGSAKEEATCKRLQKGNIGETIHRKHAEEKFMESNANTILKEINFRTLMLKYYNTGMI